MAKREFLATIRERYRESPRKDTSMILDEFIAVIGHHRKHGIRLLVYVVRFRVVARLPAFPFFR